MKNNKQLELCLVVGAADDERGQRGYGARVPAGSVSRGHCHLRIPGSQAHTRSEGLTSSLLAFLV